MDYLGIHFIYTSLYLERLVGPNHTCKRLEDLFMICLHDVIDKCAHINLIQIFCFYVPDIQGLITLPSISFWIIIFGCNLMYIKFETWFSFLMFCLCVFKWYLATKSISVSFLQIVLVCKQKLTIVYMSLF